MDELEKKAYEVAKAIKELEDLNISWVQRKNAVIDAMRRGFGDDLPLIEFIAWFDNEEFNDDGPT